MDIDTFVTTRRQSWFRLERLLDRSNRDVSSLSASDLDDLGRLYRQATSDLALAQRDFPNQKVTSYLNQLVARTHARIYQTEPLRLNAVRSFYARTFPQLYRLVLPYTTVAFLLFLLPAIVAFFAVWDNPDAIYTLLGPGVAGLVQQVEAGELWTDIAPSVRSYASTAILTNNIQVMFLTFAGGITAGLLTLYVLIFNGLNIGAIFGLLQAHGLSAGLAEFVVAHGFIELSVIFLAGGCGLYVGDGLIRPGLLGRRDALVQRGSQTVRLILGCVPLLVLAGLIEGFISPSSLPWWLKLAIGVSTGIALHGYWLAGGRSSSVMRQT